MNKLKKADFEINRFSDIEHRSFISPDQLPPIKSYHIRLDFTIDGEQTTDELKEILIAQFNNTIEQIFNRI